MTSTTSSQASRGKISSYDTTCGIQTTGKPYHDTTVGPQADSKPCSHDTTVGSQADGKPCPSDPTHIYSDAGKTPEDTTTGVQTIGKPSPASVLRKQKRAEKEQRRVERMRRQKASKKQRLPARARRDHDFELVYCLGDDYNIDGFVRYYNSSFMSTSARKAVAKRRSLSNKKNKKTTKTQRIPDSFEAPGYMTQECYNTPFTVFSTPVAYDLSSNIDFPCLPEPTLISAKDIELALRLRIPASSFLSVPLCPNRPRVYGLRRRSFTERHVRARHTRRFVPRAFGPLANFSEGKKTPLPCDPRDRRRAIRQRTLTLHKRRLEKINCQSGAEIVAGISIGVLAVIVASFWDKIRSMATSYMLCLGMGPIVEAFLDIIRAIARQLRGACGNIYRVILAIIIYYIATTLSDTMLRLGLLAAATIVLAPLFGKAWNNLHKIFQELQEVTTANTTSLAGSTTDVVATQAGGANSIGKCVATAFTCGLFDMGDGWNWYNFFLSRTTRFENISKGTDGVCDWLLENVKTLCRAICEFFGIGPYKWLDSAHKGLNAWHTEAMNILIAELSPQTRNVMQVKKLQQLLSQGQTWIDVYRHTPYERSARATMRELQTAYSVVAGFADAESNYRVEPVCVIMKGKPGIGKSLMSMPLCVRLLLDSGLVPPNSTYEDVVSQIYAGTGTSEYWSGYCNQLCHVKDDIFQTRTSTPGEANDYSALIDIINCFKTPLNMADLESKGKVFYTSPIIYGSTNVASIASEAGKVINDVSAIKRRITFPYELKIKEGYALPNGQLDYAKYLSESTNGFPWHIWECYEHDFITGRALLTPVPLDTVVSNAAAEVRKRNAAHGESKRIIEAMIAKRREGVEYTPETKPHAPSRDVIHAQSGGNVKLLAGSLFGLWGLGSLLNYFNGRWVKAVEAKLSTSIDHLTVDELKAIHRESRIRSVASRCVSWAAFFLSTIGVGLMVFKVIKWALRAFDSVPVTQSNAKDTPTARTMREMIYGSNKAAYKYSIVEGTTNEPVKAQAGDDHTHAANVRNNTYTMILHRTGGYTTLGQVLFLKGNYALLPNHFNIKIHEDDVVSIELKPLSGPSIITQKESLLSAPSAVNAPAEALLVSWPAVRQHRDITGYFVPAKSCEFVVGKALRMERHLDGVSQILTTSTCKGENNKTLQTGKHQAVVHCLLSHDMPTREGDCGTPVLIEKPETFSGKSIVGIHVAGKPGRAYAAQLSAELIDKLLKEVGAISDLSQQDMTKYLKDDVLTTQAGSLPETHAGSFTYIGELKRPVPICPVTSLQRTKWYGEPCTNDTAPAPLSPFWKEGILINPMSNALAPYSGSVRSIADIDLDHACHVACMRLTEATINSPRSILTFEQACAGVPEIGLKGVTRGTSPGFPFVYEHRSGKSDFFGTGDCDFSSESCIKLRDRVTDILCCASEGKRLAHFFIDNLKDELRPLDKVRLGKTRLISAAPLDYTIAFRVMFGTFIASVMSSSLRTGFGPGICPYSDWEDLAHHLLERGNNIIDGDFSQFDASQQAGPHVAFLDYINRWYDDGADNARIRQVLWLELLNSRHVGGSGRGPHTFVYEWHKPMPSGHPMTTICNTAYTLIILVSIFHKVCPELRFWDHVAPCALGDDHIAGVSDIAVQRYNCLSVAQFTEILFQIKYTSSDKTSELAPFTAITGASFLKRKFVLDGVHWMCPLKPSSFLFSHHWTTRPKEADAMARACIEVALEELSMHDTKLWDSNASWLIRHLAEAGGVPRYVPRQSTYRAVVCSRTEAWFQSPGFHIDEIEVSDPTYSDQTCEVFRAFPLYIIKHSNILMLYRYPQQSFECESTSSNDEPMTPESPPITMFNRLNIRAMSETKNLLPQLGMADRKPVEQDHTRRSVGERDEVLCTQAGDTVLTSATERTTPNNTNMGDESMRDKAETCAPINSLAVGNSASHVAGLTPLEKEACATVDALAHYVPNKAIPTGDDVQSIKTYFARPRILNEGTIPTSITNVYTYPLEVGTMPIIFTDFLTRTSGAYGIKFTVVLYLQVAATPQHQGLMCLSFQYGDTAVSTSTVGYARGSVSATATNLPHVRLDVAELTMSVLRIPYMYITDYLPLNLNEDLDWTYGVVNINTLLPCPTVTGMNAPTYKVMIALEDVELFGAVPFVLGTATLQSGDEVTPYDVAYLQAGNDVPGSSGVLLAEQKEEGMIGTFLNRTARAAKCLKDVPLLNSIAGPVSWAAEAGACAVSSFGYSKPTITKPPTMVIPMPTAREANVDEPSAVTVVGAFGSNTIGVDPGFAATNLDEMAFSFIKSRYSQICVPSITTTNTSGTVIYGTPVSPCCFWYRNPSSAPYGNEPAPGNDATNTAFIPSTVFWLASLFQYWRGGFRFRITFAKTKFHAGRVLLSYVPGDIGPFTYGQTGIVINTPGVNVGYQQPTGHSKVFDLRDTNVVEFDVPYMTMVPWKAFLESTGCFSVSVFDPLVCPANVAQTVELLVEVMALPDFELAVVNGPRYPINNIPTSIKYQAGTEVVPKSGGSIESTPIPEFSTSTIGEVFRSVKQLIMLPMSTAAPGTTANGTITYILPWHYITQNQNNTAATLVGNHGSFRLAGYIASAYLYARGSTDVHVYAATSGSYGPMIVAYYSKPFTTAAAATTVGPGVNVFSSQPYITTVGMSTPYAHFRFPSYQRYRRLYVGLWDGNAASYPWSTTVPTPYIEYGAQEIIGKLAFYSTSSTTINTSVNAGDDAMLGHWMGPTPLGLYPSGSTVGYDKDTSWN